MLNVKGKHVASIHTTSSTIFQYTLIRNTRKIDISSNMLESKNSEYNMKTTFGGRET